MKASKLALIIPALLVSGCFTLEKTQMDKTIVTRAPEGRDVKVSVAGFAATITEYIPVYGTQTYYVDHGTYVGRHGGRIYHAGGHYETHVTETMVPQSRASEAFVQRAVTLLEDAGYLLRAPQSDYIVDVTFGGPFVTDDERAVMFAWQFLSVLSAEYSTQTWSAKMRIYEAKTGRILMTKDYVQKYEHCVWSPLFFIGLSGCTENSYNYMQSWCLTTLTDKAVADATQFLAKQTAPSVTTPAAPAATK